MSRADFRHSDVYYLAMQLPTGTDPSLSPREHLEPYAKEVLQLASTQQPEWRSASSAADSSSASAVQPLLSLFYAQAALTPPVSNADIAREAQEHKIQVEFPPPVTSEMEGGASLPSYTDLAAQQAESIFWRIVSQDAHSAASVPPSDEMLTPEAFRRRAEEKERRRRKKRNPEEFQGRAGAFPQEGRDDAEGATIEGYEWDDVVEFFEPPTFASGSDDDE